MKLKTLKDMLNGIESCSVDFMKEVMQEEAIKWVKFGRGPTRSNDTRAINRWIKMFFNITEEDLK